MYKIIETKKIIDTLRYVNKHTLVAFDIDNTLIWSTEEFGSQPWFVHTSQQFTKKGFTPVESMEKSREILEQIDNLIFFETIEPDTLTVLNELNKHKINTIALTRRIFSDAAITIKQLDSVNIDFSKHSPHEKEEIFDDAFAFSKGILYSGVAEEKGSNLITFLEKIHYKPDNIVFVDDSEHHAKEVHNTLNAYGIPTTCIRYAGADERLQQFDPSRANDNLMKLIGPNHYKKIFKELL